MIDPNISEQERKCLRVLAKLFGENRNFLRSPLTELQKEGLEVDQPSLDVLLRMMETYGAIEKVSRTNAQEFRSFYITATAVQLVRDLDELEKQKPVDIVGQINEDVRRNRILAWVLITFFVLMAIATFINQTISIFQNLGWMAKPQ